KQTNSVRDWDEFRRIRNNCFHLDRQLYNGFISDSLNDGNHSKSFWHFLKSKKQDCGVPPIYDRDGNLCTDAAPKSEIFNNYFHSIFSNDHLESNMTSVNDNLVNMNVPHMPDVHITELGVRKQLLGI